MKRLISVEVIFCFTSLTILGIFLCSYPIPPLVDFNGHVALAMTTETSSHGFYQYHFSPTYRLLDTFGRLWNTVFAGNFRYVALMTYICVLATLLSPVFLAAKWVRLSPLTALSVVLGPAFLLSHSLLFVWGVLPFFMAVTLSAASGMILFHIDSVLSTTQNLQQPQFVWRFPYFWLGFFTFLAIYSHPAAFVYLPLSWSYTGVNFLRRGRGNNRKQILIAALLSTGFLVLALISTNLVGGSRENILDFGSIDLMQNWTAIVNGAYYQISGLAGGDKNVGLFAFKAFRLALVMTPLLVLTVVILKRDNICNRFRTFLAYQGGLSILIISLAPNRWWALSTFPYRHWLYWTAICILSMVYCLNLLSPKMRRILLVSSPLLTALCCFPLKSVYSAFNQVPLDQAATAYAAKLGSLVASKRPLFATPGRSLIIEYRPSQLGPWFHHKIVPFLMLNSDLLLRQNIILRHEWELTDKHLPIQLDPVLLKNTQVWLWDPIANGQIGELVPRP